MKFQIQQNKLRDEVKKRIFDGFGKQAIESTGINGLEEDPISFEIFNEQEFVGAIVVQSFWGQLHIKYLFVEKHFCFGNLRTNRWLINKLYDHKTVHGILSPFCAKFTIKWKKAESRCKRDLERFT